MKKQGFIFTAGIGFFFFIGTSTVHAQVVSVQENHFQLGLEAYEAQRDQDAIKQFLQAIRAHPANARAHYFLGLAYQRQRHHKKAVQAFRRSLEIEPEASDRFLPLGISLYRLEQHEAARLEFSKVLQNDPENKTAHFFIGLIYLKQKKFDFAASHLEQAAQDKSLEAMARFNLGIAYFNLKKTEKAKREFREVERLDAEESVISGAKQFQEIMDSKGKEKRPWTLEAEAGVEFSDNVTRIERDEVTDESDYAVTLGGSASYKFLDKSGYKATAGYDFYQSLYHDITTQNFQSHTGTLNFAKDFQKWEAGLDYSYNYNFLDKKDFLQIQTLSPKVSFFTKTWLFSQIIYTIQEKVFFDDSERDALTHKVGFHQFFFFANAKGYLLLGAQYEAENASAGRFDFHGYTGNAIFQVPISLLYSRLFEKDSSSKLAWEANLQLGYAYRFKDFMKETPSIGRKRHDDNQTIRIGLESKVVDGLWCSIKYRYTKNASNLESVEYQENALTLALIYKF